MNARGQASKAEHGGNILKWRSRAEFDCDALDRSPVEPQKAAQLPRFSRAHPNISNFGRLEILK
jgi:hypothetical protein